ncbi:hypothetical protein PYW07_012725 [Mythimna separata]|uniref:Uncharacterized protein n=1 Tax=Mythimna separata TaxID=271217 RepID=A0AAD7Y8S0_MYTSE|nr:hypothetical protein PYW07_012725 [Mythimna separata]
MLRAFVFCILLQTAFGAMEYGYRRNWNDQPELANYARQAKQKKYEQIISNLHSLFKERSSSNNDDSKSDDYNDFNYNQNSEDKQQLDAILTEVTSALDNIKEELIKFNADGILSVETPAVKRERRYKRDVTNANVTVTNATSTESNVTVTANVTEKVEAVTAKVKLLRENNVTVKTEVLRTNNNETLDSGLSGRRMMPMVASEPQYVTTTSRVKDKLLSYLEDTFNEVERKIKPLTNIKIALSNDDHYRIGYIIATIDTLEVNLKKLKNDMNINQNKWDDEKILDLFDRIKASNTVVTSLIESLKKYLPKK